VSLAPGPRQRFPEPGPVTGGAPGRLRIAAAACAVLGGAAAWSGGKPPPVRVLVVDSSRSVRGAGDSEALAWLAAKGGDGPGLEDPGVVYFAETALVSRLPGAAPHRPPSPGSSGNGTGIAAALRAALALVPEGSPGEVVLATDGRDTAGGVGEALAEARRRGVAVRAIPWGKGPLPVRVAAVRAPARVRPGDRIAVSVELTGSAGEKGTVVLEDRANGGTEEREVTVPVGGRARIVFAREVGGHGVRRFRAFARGPLADAAAEAAVLVEGEAAVLRLGREPAGTGTADLLRRLAGAGSFRDASGEQAVAEALARTDLPSLALVVLDDLPEAILPPDGGERLSRAVEGGLGLAVLGGPHSLGPGGYAGRPVEEALPVRCAPERPRPLVVLAVDVSGSMEGEASGGGTLAGAARTAAADLADRLPSDARLALVRFNDALVGEPEVFDLGDPAGRASAAAAAGRVVAPGGGTRFAAAAEGARAAAARAPGGGSRRILLVTDGRPSESVEELRTLARALEAERFSVRVIPVGIEEAADRLSAFAGGAGGEVIPPGPRGATARSLAATLLAESMEDSARLWRPGESVVRPGPDPAPFGAVPGGLPPVEGRDRVFPRKGAALWLLAEGGEPLLAARRAGPGRSVVFAAPPAAGGAGWVSGPAAEVLGAALRWAMREPGRGDAAAAAETLPDGSLAVRLETEPAAAPGGEVTVGEIRLRRTGVSRWEGVVPASAAGEAGVLEFRAGEALLARAAAAPAPFAEDAALGPDPEALAALEVPGREPPGRRGGAGPAALAAAAAALLLLLAAAALEARSSTRLRAVQDA